MAEADVVVGNAARQEMLSAVAKALATGERVVDIRAHEKARRSRSCPWRPFEGHTRAFIKVQDGCDRQCAYCVIPKARGAAAAALRAASWPNCRPWARRATKRW